MSTTSSSPDKGIRESLAGEARRLLAAADTNTLPLGLLGGMGIHLLLGERLHPHFQREIGDLDFITTRRAGAAIEALLAASGWEPQQRFNAIHGARRLLFEDSGSAHRIDIFVGSFQMCHQLPLLQRLNGRAEILPAAELALTKLQIITLNAKDRDDLYALLLACPLFAHDAPDDTGPDHPNAAENADDAENTNAAENADRAENAADAENAGPTIDVHSITELTGADWGLHHTVELNLARLRDGVAETDLAAAQRELLGERIAALLSALELAPKSRAWRLRARVGERRRWFEEPEEIAR